MTPLLQAVIAAQLAAGADVVMILDTAAGDLPPSYLAADVAPALAGLARTFPRRLGYYAKHAHPVQLDAVMAGVPWAGVGVDSRWDLSELLRAPQRRTFVQGNFDPAWLFLPPADLERAIIGFLDPIVALPPAQRRGWICGLGHGVLPGTPEPAVRTFVRLVRERCA
jgi:uroporphyrinogen decarboxylase